MTPIPTTGIIAGWRGMASVNGAPVFCNSHPALRDAPRDMSGSASTTGTKTKADLGAIHWGSRMLKRLVEKGRSSQSKKKRVSPGQQQLPFAFDVRLNQIPEKWH